MDRTQYRQIVALVVTLPITLPIALVLLIVVITVSLAVLLVPTYIFVVLFSLQLIWYRLVYFQCKKCYHKRRLNKLRRKYGKKEEIDLENQGKP